MLACIAISNALIGPTALPLLRQQKVNFVFNLKWF